VSILLTIIYGIVLISPVAAQSTPASVEVRLFASPNSLTIYVSGGIKGIPIDLRDHLESKENSVKLAE